MVLSIDARLNALWQEHAPFELLDKLRSIEPCRADARSSSQTATDGLQLTANGTAQGAEIPNSKSQDRFPIARQLAARGSRLSLRVTTGPMML